MRATRAVIAAAFIVLCAVPALAQTSRLYMAGYLGLNMAHDRDFDDSANIPNGGSLTFNNTPSFAGALGLRLSDNIRVEGEVSYSNPGISHADFNNGTTSTAVGGQVKTWLALLNLYYDFGKWHEVQPFVSAGIGLANHRASIDGLTDASGTSTGFAWQAGAGLKYRVSPGMAFTGNYRYVGASDAKIGSAKIKYGAQELRFGLEYDLPSGWLK
jgi:opacity protein-like surface antigen